MNYPIDLNLTPGGVPQIVKVSQYDKTLPVIKAKLWDGTTTYSIPGGADIHVSGTKPDKTGFDYVCTYDGAVVNIPITQQMSVIAGRVPCEVIIYLSGGRKGSANFFLDVEPAALSDDTNISDTEIPGLVELAEAQVKDAEAWANGTRDGVPTTADDPTYHKDAHYWALQAAGYSAVPFTVVDGKVCVTYTE